MTYLYNLLKDSLKEFLALLLTTTDKFWNFNNYSNNFNKNCSTTFDFKTR